MVKHSKVREDNLQQGAITIIALMVLVVLTLLGLSVTRNSTTDIQIAANQIPYKENFYLAEGGLNREAAELGRGNYPVTDINTPSQLASQASPDLPGPPHEINGKGYDFTVEYLGSFQPPAGYSAIHFSRYDYFVDVKGGNVRVAGRYYR
ncbi:MAG: hypothetical protein JRJ03_16385, partial [Deltaproteobacteria bacterium]|nr:hypothetical protein [Deltaproteobacteria bacterium]